MKKPITITLQKICFLQLALLLLPAISAFAQIEKEAKTTILKSEAPTLRFEHLGANEGMAQASANSMMQDSQGYLWIATQGGLHRYDGHEFKVFAATPFDTTSLSESWVWGMSEAKNGDIWVTTEGAGLNRLDQATGQFKKYFFNPEDSTSLSSNRTSIPFEDSRGDLWVGTFDNGLNRMKAGEDGKFIRFVHVHDDSTTLSSQSIFFIDEDAEGNIWAGSNNGVNRIDPKTNKVTRFLFDEDGSKFYGSSNFVPDQYLPKDQPDIVWLATGDGLVRLTIKTGSYERFQIAPNENNTVNPLNDLLKVVPDPNNLNVLWVGGRGTGVARFDIQAETFTTYRHNSKDPNSLSENIVQSLFADRSGTIWVGTSTEGLDAFNPGAVNFTHLSNDPDNDESMAPGIVWGLYEDKNDVLWIATDVGSAGTYLTQFDIITGETTRYKFNPDDSTTLLPGNYQTFADDADNKSGIWVGGSVGLNYLNRSTGKSIYYQHPFLEENWGRNNIFALLPTAADERILWVGSIGGLDRFNTRTRTFEHVFITADTSDQEPIILSLVQDSEHTLWAGTNGGLFRIDPKGEITLASAYNPRDTTAINDDKIQAMVARPEEPGVIWLAMHSGGLNRYDSNTGKALHYTTKDGLPSNTVYGLLEDNSGTLWMSTNNGISNFDPATKTFRNYGLDDGLMALEYNQSAFSKGKNGVLYFGSGKGVTAFVPEQLHTNEVPPQIALSDFKLFNQSVPIAPDSPLTKPLNKTKKIKLNYTQNEVAFNFVALHFANADKNTYAYQLVGFDKDWINAGTQRSATYTNLPPNDYTFRVKAANADGVWNEQGISIQLSILPPWYQTWWAYAFFLCVIGLAVFGIDRAQRYRLSKKERERSSLREAELRAEAENKRRADTEQLSQIGQAITSTLSVEKIIETVYENVNALMDASIFGVGIYNKEKNLLEFPATKEKGKMLPPYVNRVDKDDRLSVWCFKNKEDVIISDYQIEHTKYLKSYKPPIEGEDSASVLYLPLIQQNRVIGVITTQSFNKNAYTEYHVNLLRNLATYAAIAIDNASAYRRLNATLSELQDMQQQLVQQEKLASLGQLTAGIAHEIKNPLNFVNNFSELSVEMIDEVRTEIESIKAYGDAPVPSKALDEISELLDDIDTNLKKIHEHGSRADSIVKSMLQHSRGGSGKKSPTDLNGLIKEFVHLSFHGMRAGKNPINVDLQFDLDERIKVVPLIAEDFSRIIVNLCNNAFDAMREKLVADDSGKYKPILTIRTQQKDDGITVDIEDNGPGIPQKIKSKIMQPFFTTKKGTEGTGLGLSITNDIIKAHGGTLEIETKDQQFTRFRVYLT